MTTAPPIGETIMRRSCLFALSLAALLLGCSSETGGNRRDTMTKRQRDSVLGQTGLPGSQGISKAMRAADSAKARNARIDSASRP